MRERRAGLIVESGRGAILPIEVAGNTGRTWPAPALAAIVVSIAAAAGIIVAAVGWQLAPVRDRMDDMDGRLGRVEVALQDHGERLGRVEATLESICRRLQCGAVIDGDN